MKIQWNTTYAEILRGIDLKLVHSITFAQRLACLIKWLIFTQSTGNQSVDGDDAQIRLQKGQGGHETSTKGMEIESGWVGNIGEIVCCAWGTLCVQLFQLSLVADSLIQKFQATTLEFLQANLPMISKVLPLFKMIQKHLQEALWDPNITKDKSGQKYHGLKNGLKAGLNKIDIHLNNALVGDYPLLGARESPVVLKLGISSDTMISSASIHSSPVLRRHYEIRSLHSNTC